MLLSSYNPVVFSMSLLSEEAAVIALGSIILVSMMTTGPGVSYSSSNPGKSAAK